VKRPAGALPTRDDWFELGTATVAEAAGMPCILEPAIRPAWPGARVCGPALPVWCPGGTNLAIHWALDVAEPGSVLVVEAHGHLAGYWGEVLTRAALARGVAGVVINGGIRDVDAIEEIGFPAFATGIGMPGTGKTPDGAVGAPVTLGGVRVHPGSLIVGDRDGVVALPASALSRIHAAAADRRRRERHYLDRIAAGERTVDIYGWRHRPAPLMALRTPASVASADERGGPGR
jgi:4-hydroxy-4-methyl-2-oxoglutarate aldolase